MKNMVTDFKDFNLGRETDLNICVVKIIINTSK